MAGIYLITTPDAGVIQGVEVATVGPGEVRSMQRKLSLYLLDTHTHTC